MSIQLTEEEQNLLNNAIRQNLLPENSPSLLVNDETRRFSSAEWYTQIQQQKVTVAGVGGIGSYVAFLLSRMKLKELVLYDGDIVERVNMSGQLYGRTSVGKAKVTALYEFIENYADISETSVNAKAELFTPTSYCTNVLFCGFDNMNARKIAFNRWKEVVDNTVEEEKSKCLLIDGRLAAEELQVFCIKGTDKKAQEIYQKEWLFDDSEAEETVCSYKQTTFCANMIASYMVNCFVNFVANQLNPIVPRNVPFKINYNAKLMFTKIIAPWQL